MSPRRERNLESVSLGPVGKTSLHISYVDVYNCEHLSLVPFSLLASRFLRPFLNVQTYVDYCASVVSPFETREISAAASISNPVNRFTLGVLLSRVKMGKK